MEGGSGERRAQRFARESQRKSRKSGASRDARELVKQREALVRRFFDAVGFRFEKVFEYMKSNKKKSFRGVDYDSFLRILNLQKNAEWGSLRHGPAKRVFPPALRRPGASPRLTQGSKSSSSA